MPHVVTDECVKCKYTDCVEVCPVDCFHEADDFLVINPDVCIDCGVCVPECPVEAIINDENHVDGKPLDKILDADDKHLTNEQLKVKYLADFNSRQSRILPAITEKKEQLESADLFSNKHNKISFIKEFDNKDI